MSARPREKFEVVDQNYLRDHGALLTHLTRMSKDGVAFGVTATTVGEMLKSARWRDTMLRSLEFLSRCPGQVCALRQHAQVLTDELSTGNAATTLIDDWTTLRIRQVLSRMQKEPSLLETFEEGRRYVASGESPLYDRQKAWERFQEGLRVFDAVFTSSDKKLLRRGQTGPLVEALASEVGDRAIEGTLGSLTAEDHAAALTRAQSFSATNVIVDILRYAQWIARGGGAGLDPAKAMNDRLDDTYVVYALHGHGLLTKEVYLNARYADAVDVLERRWARWNGPSNPGLGADRPVA